MNGFRPDSAGASEPMRAAFSGAGMPLCQAVAARCQKRQQESWQADNTDIFRPACLPDSRLCRVHNTLISLLLVLPILDLYAFLDLASFVTALSRLSGLALSIVELVFRKADNLEGGVNCFCHGIIVF